MTFNLCIPPEYDTYGLCISNLSDDAKVKVSVDKKSIATPEWNDKEDVVFVHAKKPGTVKVTIKVKQDGKNYTHVTKMTWVKYKIPSLRISRGGKTKDIKNGSKIKFNKKGDANTVLFINYTDPKGNRGILRLFADNKNCTY